MNKDPRESISEIEKIHKLLNDNYPAVKKHREGELSSFFEHLKAILKYNEMLVPKSVAKFDGMSFLVDSYQRGYKWTSQQVHDLLVDIKDFELCGRNFYCLQPVVVKYHETQGDDQKGVWELIDGQQRVTTIYMILHYLQKNVFFDIDHKTRTGSATFLRNHLATTLDFEEGEWLSFVESKKKSFPHVDNIDNYHFFKAYHTVDDFFRNTLGDDDKKIEKWKEKFLERTQVIWYDATGTESTGVIENQTNTSIDIFTRLNSGKIPLVNAELIKALFLTSVSYNEVDLQKQIELAKEWDDFEQTLQNPELWYFLKEDADTTDTNRISLIFELALIKIKEKEDENNDDLKLFRTYSRILKIKGAPEDVSRKTLEVWDAVRSAFYTVMDWFQNDNIEKGISQYHSIGFLVATGKTIKDIYADFCESRSKKEFRNKISGLVTNAVNSSNWKELSYEKSKEKDRLQKILLLFNLKSMGKDTRFSFYKYRREDWSIEHIHAQKTPKLDKDSEREVWVDDMMKKVSETKNDQMEEIMSLLIELRLEWNADKEIEIKKRLYRFFGNDDENEEVHTIENLALLDCGTNSSLSNDYFSEKRQKIIDADKKGKFIPVATKNVFLKYYSDEVGQFHKWGYKDRENYVSEIEKCLFSKKGGNSDN